jgi:hypothetical protein
MTNVCDASDADMRAPQNEYLKTELGVLTSAMVGSCIDLLMQDTLESINQASASLMPFLT